MQHKDKRYNEKEDPERKYIGKTNLPDYGVPSGIQLTENLNEEITEAVKRETPEIPPEK